MERCGRDRQAWKGADRIGRAERVQVWQAWNGAECPGLARIGWARQARFAEASNGGARQARTDGERNRGEWQRRREREWQREL